MLSQQGQQQSHEWSKVQEIKSQTYQQWSTAFMGFVRWNWDHVIDQNVEDKDQGQSKEWEQKGWYQFPTKEQIDMAKKGRPTETLTMLVFKNIM